MGWAEREAGCRKDEGGLRKYHWLALRVPRRQDQGFLRMEECRMRFAHVAALITTVAVAGSASGQEHQHPGEKLGTVHFANSCSPTAAASFDRAIALLHSFEF